MTVTAMTWLLFRCLRWLFWAATVGYYIEFMVHKSDHLNSFNNMLPATEFWIFVLPLAAVFMGFLELMMRERVGVPRPAFGRNWIA